MATPVVQTISTNSATTGTTLVVTKPTGVAIGDLLISFFGYQASGTGSTPTITTPSGWAIVQSYPDSSNDPSGFACFSKTADSGDVAATNYTFGSNRSGPRSACILRITGRIASKSIQSEIDSAEPIGFPHTTNLTPNSPNSLVIFGVQAGDRSIGGTPTVSGYAITPSATMNEVADIGTKDGTDAGLFFGVATASTSSLTTITSRTATFSEAPTDPGSSIIVLVPGSFDTTGTNALHSVSPTLFTQSGNSGTTGTNDLLEVSPYLPDQNGVSYDVTQWTDKVKEQPTWTPQTK